MGFPYLPEARLRCNLCDGVEMALRWEGSGPVSPGGLEASVGEVSSPERHLDHERQCSSIPACLTVIARGFGRGRASSAGIQSDCSMARQLLSGRHGVKEHG